MVFEKDSTKLCDNQVSRNDEFREKLIQDLIAFYRLQSLRKTTASIAIDSRFWNVNQTLVRNFTDPRRLVEWLHVRIDLELYANDNLKISYKLEANFSASRPRLPRFTSLPHQSIVCKKILCKTEEEKK